MSLLPHDKGAAQVYRNINANATGVTITTKPTAVFGIQVTNCAAALRYLKVYDVIAGATPANTDTPVVTIAVNANQSVTYSPTCGYQHGYGLGIRATTGVADNDTGNPTTNDVIVNIVYAGVP
jgi:hypothetical protein